MKENNNGDDINVGNMENNIQEDINILNDFIEGNFQKDKLENYKGSYKMGYSYYKDIQQALEHILSDYKRLQEEFKAVDHECRRLEQKEVELEKTIDLMAEVIEDEFTVDKFCTKKGCYADNYIDGHCEKCLNCIKQYFINKAKEVK